MLDSYAIDLGDVELPPWQGRQKYMHTFDPQNPVMAPGYDDFGPVVAALCVAAGVTASEAHMTVDEAIVEPGMSQRRPGAHVDGCFMPERGFWGHGGSGGWKHYCNNVPAPRMSVIVAASVPGCTVYEGKFDGEPMNDGDLEHIREQLGDGRMLPAGQGFLLSPDCVHESKRFSEPTKRTFLRIAFHEKPADQG